MKKTYTGVDIVKVMAAYGIVSIHSGTMYISTLGRLGVPFFAIISGFFFYKKYLGCNNDVRKKVLFSYLKRILLLYISWQIVYLPLVLKEAFSNIHDHGSSITNWSIFALRFIFPGYGYTTTGKFIPGTNGWGVSWYLIAIIMGLPLLCVLVNHLRTYIVTVICIVLEFCYICSSGYGFITHFYFWGALTFLRILIYLFIGFLFAKYSWILESPKFYFLVLTTMLSIFLFILENKIIFSMGGSSFSEEVFLTVPTSTLVSMLALRCNPNINRNIGINIRKYSTFIYTSQIIFINIISKLIANDNSFNVAILKLFIILLFITITFVLYIIFQNKYKIRILSYLV